MDNKENRTRANFAQRYIAIFFPNMRKVPNGHRVRIIKHKLGRLEIDLMLGEVLLALPLVPLKTHGTTTFNHSNCTYRCQYIQERRVGHLSENPRFVFYQQPK